MHSLWSNIFRKKPEEESLAYFLGTVPCFAELKGRELTYLESLIHLRNYTSQETVFEEGDAGSGMYIIRSGRVRIFNRTSNGKEEELAILGPGDFFGETTLTAPAKRTASARTLEASELLGLFRADLLETAQRHPAISNKILLGVTRVFSERLQAAALENRAMREALEAARTPSED